MAEPVRNQILVCSLTFCKFDFSFVKTGTTKHRKGPQRTPRKTAQDHKGSSRHRRRIAVARCHHSVLRFSNDTFSLGTSPYTVL